MKGLKNASSYTSMEFVSLFSVLFTNLHSLSALSEYRIVNLTLAFKPTSN